MIAALALLAATVSEPATIVSPAPDRVSITVYRNPGRGTQRSMNLYALGGFALITETRTIHVPAGQAILRFAGVADGIIPASAIITGLPGGVIEKNRDAQLLSPAALIDGTLGRNVTVRRTDRATGAVTEEVATIVAGQTSGVVLRTPTGILALRCSGLPEGVTYGGVPSGLSATPVLSVATHNPTPAAVTVTLAYLTSGFDWSASYVANVAPDGRSLDLFAWLTLANNNGQAWRGVKLQAVAGRLHRQHLQELAAAAARLELRCYPLGTTTSDLPTLDPYRRDELSQDIVVTAMRVAAPPVITPTAPLPPPPPPPPPPEDLGDLKLYRLPALVDVSGNGQKQVALLAKRAVPFEKVYRIRLDRWQMTQRRAATITLRVRNEKESGLGLPLPAGTTSLYQPRGGTRLLLGTGLLGDTAMGETARFTAGISPQVLAELTSTGRRRHVTLSNANPFAISFEVALGQAVDPPYLDATTVLERVDGVQTWHGRAPPNGSVTLDYSLPSN